jgi:ubiquinone/menaquinone biosynthesis C-methylase UbiE
MSIIKNASSLLKERPLKVIAWMVACKILKIKIRNFNDWKQLVKNKSGIEIGGPSGIFSKNHFLPIYPYLKSLDGVNFSSQTLWEGEIEQGNNYKFGGKTGYQFIAEGSDLRQIQSQTYDFLLSCNNLEHIANPLKALAEWKRVLKKGGALILILPKKESNFDHKRSVTSLEHVIKDYENNIDERDTSVIEEVLRLHDLNRDPKAGNFENFKKRSENNFSNRTLHHHVFDTDLLKQMVEHIGMKTLITYSSPIEHFIAAIKEDT